MSALATAIELAKKDRSKKGRTRYSPELKKAIRDAAKSHSKSKIAKDTSISYPTVLKIIGTNRSAPAKNRRARRAPAGAASLAITVTLPSGKSLEYSDLSLLKADAKALSQAASST